jgi:hypothetical protein
MFTRLQAGSAWMRNPDEMTRPLRRPVISSAAARLGASPAASPAANAIAEAQFCSRAKRFG